MSLKDITQAAADKNPLALKTAVEAELNQRVVDALQAKMENAFAVEEELDLDEEELDLEEANDEDEEDEEDEDDEDEDEDDEDEDDD